jgi:hypothetical protein
MADRVDDYCVAFNGVQHAIPAMNHLSQFDADGLCFGRDAISLGKRLERGNPTPESFDKAKSSAGSILSGDIIAKSAGRLPLRA